MNKNDYKLILIIFIISISFFVYYNIYNSKNKVAKVYYENKLIKELPLNINKEYTVSGYNGDVVIEVYNNKVRVIKETSKRNLCSKQGYSNIIVCLPNKIIIKVENAKEELDGVVK